ncbi:MAG: hypothetical protein ACRCTK_02175 [Alphaproteobacteria bacterium]
MSSQLISATFFKLALIVLMAPQFAFSTGTAETSSEPRSKYRKLNEKLVSQHSPFERLPSNIINLILAELPKKDLVSLRAVERKLKEIATSLITNVEIPANLPNQKQVERFFKDLTTVKFLEKNGTSEAFVKLFRQAPVEDLSLSNREINDEKITTIAPALPVNLKNLDLSENNIGDAGIQALVLRLPPTLESLNLSYNNIGDAGAQALRFPSTLKWLQLGGNNIGDIGLSALLEAIPRTDLGTLVISVPSS